MLLKLLSGEDSQGKINQSILTLWVNGIQSITLDLLCNYALLNVGIQTCVFLTFLLLHVYLLFEGRMVTDCGFIAFLYFYSGDNWPLDQVFCLLRGYHGGSERYDNPRKILHKEHAHWWQSQSNSISFLFLSAMYLSVIQPNKTYQYTHSALIFLRWWCIHKHVSRIYF